MEAQLDQFPFLPLVVNGASQKPVIGDIKKGVSRVTPFLLRPPLAYLAVPAWPLTGLAFAFNLVHGLQAEILRLRQAVGTTNGRKELRILHGSPHINTPLSGGFPDV